jgi:hypothetical protein
VERWQRLGRRPPLVLTVADELFAARAFSPAAEHYRAARLEAPHTEWADLWPALRRGRCLLYLQGQLTEPQRRELEAARRTALLVARAPGAQADFARTFQDYARRLLAETPVQGGVAGSGGP